MPDLGQAAIRYALGVYSSWLLKFDQSPEGCRKVFQSNVDPCLFDSTA